MKDNFYSLSSGRKIKTMITIVLYLLFMNYPAVFADSFDIHQQSGKTISGIVSDQSGEPLIGVNVSVKGSSTGTMTNTDGTFSITVPASATLVFSYIGYNTIEQVIGSQTSFTIVMGEDLQLLEEVVVIGYGVQKKETLTGSVSNIKTEEIARSPVSNLTNSLMGKMPGIISQQITAEPGEDGANLYIRGRSTLNDNSPLILVDGIDRDFSQLSPNEIESITILKDASATAVYGVRGANGVILVTTKRGAEGKPTVNYNGYVGIQNPTRVPKFLNSYDYAVLYNEASRNDNPLITDNQLQYQPSDLEKYKNHSSPYTHPDVDWYDVTRQKNAVQQRHFVSLSGGAKTIAYFLSVGYFDQKAMFKNVDYSKYNLRANIDANVTPTTKISINLAGVISQRNYPGVPNSQGDGGIVSTAEYLPANAFPIKNEDGTWSSLWGVNPVADLTDAGHRRNDNQEMTTSFILDQKLDFITKNLSLKLLGSYDYGNGFWKDWYTPYRSFFMSEDGEYEEIAPGRKAALYQGLDRWYTTNFEAHLNWQESFGSHNLGILALYTQSATYENEEELSREEYSSAAVDQIFAGPETYMRNNGGASEYGREGFVGRVTYNYAQRYLFEFNFGYNGSENFPLGKRYGFFPAFSAAWRISEEKFFQSVDLINNLKIKGSYGEVGNDKVGGRRFMYKQPVRFGNNVVFGGSSPSAIQTLYLGVLANEYVTWERAEKTNIAIESDWLNSLFKLNVDVFWEKRSNILATREQSIPNTFGASLPTENIAKVSNRGFEVELMHRNKISNLTYFASANYTFNVNKIIFIDEPANVLPNQMRTGRPMGQFFGYINDGFYNTQEEVDNYPRIEGVEPKLGDLKYRDVNNDGKIDQEDYVPIGNSPVPKHIFGLNLGLEYGGFDLKVLFQGAGGFETLRRGDAHTSLIYGSNGMEILLDRWTPENKNAKFPSLTTERDTYQTENSTFWLKNGNYLRLKNAEIGYTLPKGTLSKLAITNCRIYVSGENLLTFDHLKYWDPESTAGSGWYYPMQQIMTVGLNVTF